MFTTYVYLYMSLDGNHARLNGDYISASRQNNVIPYDTVTLHYVCHVGAETATWQATLSADACYPDSPNTNADHNAFHAENP